jgi:hypothetical protein
MVSEFIAGASAFKTMFDMAKALKDINDATVRNGAVIELQREILAAQTQQATLIDHVRQLEEKVRGFENWDAEKAKYELKEVYPGSFAYEAKADARGREPPHLICASCYQQAKKSILQQTTSVEVRRPDCKTSIQVRGPKSLDPMDDGLSRGPHSWMGR